MVTWAFLISKMCVWHSTYLGMGRQCVGNHRKGGKHNIFARLNDIAILAPAVLCLYGPCMCLYDHFKYLSACEQFFTCFFMKLAWRIRVKHKRDESNPFLLRNEPTHPNDLLFAKITWCISRKVNEVNLILFL